MTNHPPIVSLPQALWQYPGDKPMWMKEYESWALDDIRRSFASGFKAPIQREVLELLPYRPDLLAEIGPEALEHPALQAHLIAHPASALALIMAYPAEVSDFLEPTLEGSGESTYHLLKWAEESGYRLQKAERFYRRSLVADPFWGYLHAKRTSNASLTAELHQWCQDHFKEFAAAASHHLFRNPKEPVAPYRELLLANPFYAYLSYPGLSLRGFSVAPEDVGGSPKWGCHFAWTDFSPSTDGFVALAAKDPAWLIELASGLGWLTQPQKIAELGRMISASSGTHALARPAMQFLLEAKRGLTGVKEVAIV